MKARVPLFWLLAFWSHALCGFCEQQGPYTYIVTNGTATIVGFDPAYAGHLQITNSLGGYPVSAIGEKAFELCAKLTSLVIPDTVTNLGKQAFSLCTGLTNITIGAGLETFRLVAAFGIDR